MKRGRPRNEDRREEYRRLYDQGKSYSEIGAMFSVSKQSVQQILSDTDITPREKGRQPRLWNFSDYAQIIGEMREIGRGICFIGKTIGIQPSSHQWAEFADYVESFPKYGGHKYKKCSKCGVTGDDSLFYQKGGFCKKCQKEYYRIKRENMTPEQKRAYSQYICDWRLRHKRAASL